MDSMQNQSKTQHTQQMLASFEQENIGIQAQNREYRKINRVKVEGQSKYSGAHQCKNGGKIEKFETNREESIYKGLISVTDRTKEREMEVENGGEVGPRERLKRHRTEVAGHVWIPDIWGQEELLKDWIDCAGFDACLVPQGIMSARASLIEEGISANSGSLIVENSC